MTTTKTIDQLKDLLKEAELVNPAVSAWSVGKHIEHCCLAMKTISKTLLDSKPPSPRSEHPLRAFLLLTFGKIPRGRGKSPKPAIPSETTPSTQRLTELINDSYRLTEEAKGCDPDCWFNHFFFGRLRRDQALKFIAIHNKHHLKIVADICKNGIVS